MIVPFFDVGGYVNNALPPNKRKPKWLLFMQAIADPLRRLQTFFVYFMNGSTDAGYWSNLIIYAKGDLVQDISGVYESQSGGNLNNPITDATFWLKVLDSFIGASERARFTGRYLDLTYALNRYFNTTFRPLPYPAPYDFGLGGGTFSDIYLTTDTPAFFSFVGFRGVTKPANSVYSVPSGYFSFTGVTIVGDSSSYKYTIHIPTAAYTALGASAAIRESVVWHFVDGLNIGGLQYSIVVY